MDSLSARARSHDGGATLELPGAPAMSDPHAKRARTFQCRDALWASLEQIAGDLECTVDYLVNDALKHYVRQRLTRHPQPGALAAPPASAPAPPPTPPGQYQPLAAPPMRPPPPPSLHLVPPPIPPPPPPARIGAPPPLPPQPFRSAPTAPPPLPPPPFPRSFAAPPRPPPPPGFGAPPPLPPGFAAPTPAPALLTVSYAGQTSVVDRPGFVIGRGKAAGLSIKDPNISRRHAVIEEQGGAYYLVDLGSTNGTFVNGWRITRKAIADGDVARICEHEVHFALKRPGGA
jgi:FHA domain